jgi:mRNA interferase MazF
MSGLHPCVVVQNDVGNQHSVLTIVVAVTGNLRVAALPIGVLVTAGEGGLTKDSVVHCGHVYTVDQRRLRNKMGDLTPARLNDVDRALARSLGLPVP